MTELPDTLFARLARGGVSVVAAQAARLLLRLASMVTLARLLTPADFGLFGMAALAYGLLHTGRDLGLYAVAVQRGELSAAESNRFFWLQFGAGLAIAALTAGVAPIVAGFFEDARLVPVLGAMGIGFLFHGAGGQFRVELSRRLAFGRLSAIEVAGLLAGLLTAIALAAGGAAHWSLVALVLVQEFVVMAASIWLSPWRPTALPQLRGSRDDLVRGLHLSGFYFAQFLWHSLDQAVVATLHGARALGHYGRAWQLGTLPTHGLLAGLTGWMVQGLVKLRDDPVRFREWTRRILNALAYPCALLAALFWTAPHQVIHVLLGPQWEEAAEPLRWMAPSLLLQPWSFALSWILTSCRQERRLLLWTIIRVGTLAAGLAIAGAHSIVSVAIVTTSVHWLLLPAGLVVAARSSPLTMGDFLASHVRPVGFGLVLTLVLGLGTPYWAGLDELPALAFACGIAVIVTSCATLIPSVRRELFAGISLLTGRVR